MDIAIKHIQETCSPFDHRDELIGLLADEMMDTAEEYDDEARNET